MLLIGFVFVRCGFGLLVFVLFDSLGLQWLFVLGYRCGDDCFRLGIINSVVYGYVMVCVV